ncbi:MAG: glycoside hydrolase family 38 N-terminal domain-containing protein, partial [Victivallaceae bacterium]
MIKTVHIINHTHTDIGYTDLPHKVKIQHLRHLDKAIELCRRYADAPPGEQYRWVIESLWVLDEYLKKASSARRRILLQLMHDGLIELSGFYHQPLTQLTNLQELEEELRFGSEFAAQHKLRMDTLILNDIGGVSWNMPQIMKRKGLKNFILGTGGWRVMTPVAGLPHIFRYVGPDGSKAVMYNLGLGKDLHPGSVEQLYAQYGFAVIYLLFPFRKNLRSDGEKADLGQKGDAPMYELIARLEKEGYNYDRLLLQCGMDNAGPQEDIMEVVRQWNSSHSDIRLEIGTASDFFSYIETKYGSKLPELCGELTCSWTEHVLT